MLSVGNRQQRKAVFVGFTGSVKASWAPSRHHRATVRITTKLIALIVVEQDLPTRESVKPRWGEVGAGVDWAGFEGSMTQVYRSIIFAAKDSSVANPPPLFQTDLQIQAGHRPLRLRQGPRRCQ